MEYKFFDLYSRHRRWQVSTARLSMQQSHKPTGVSALRCIANFEVKK